MLIVKTHVSVNQLYYSHWIVDEGEAGVNYHVQKSRANIKSNSFSINQLVIHNFIKILFTDTSYT